MKKIRFIQTLVKKGKIKLVEASEDVSASYNQKSRNSLRAAKLLLPQDLLEEATSMGYYAMYHKALSLFFRIGIKCQNHSATIILFENHARGDFQVQKSACRGEDCKYPDF